MAFMIKTYIFDIDITLCDTWPTLGGKKRNLLFHFFYECWRVSHISPFPGMMRCVKSRLHKRNCEVFFLSARHWSLWLPTYIYLLRKVGLFSPLRLTLVPNAHSKMRCFDKCLESINGPLIVVDDLSYNSEHGSTLYYIQVIEYLRGREKSVRYIDKSRIDIINRV